MSKGAYKKEITLAHDEIPAKINLRTGEIKEINKRPNNIPEGSSIFLKDAEFKKYFPNSWSFLKKYLTRTELTVAYQLAEMSKRSTNSLKPLSHLTTIPELVEILNLSKNVVTPILKKLFALGVYGQFDVALADEPYTKYWIFNPYLTFQGKIIKNNIETLFSHTHCGKAFIDKDYTLDDKTIKELKLKQNKKKESE